MFSTKYRHQHSSHSAHLRVCPAQRSQLCCHIAACRQIKDLQQQAGGHKDGSWSLIGADSSSLTEQDRWLIRHQVTSCC
eukprot:1158801-Pelagomonas_calceolata.AAC.11